MPLVEYKAFKREKALPRESAYRVYGTMGDGHLQEAVTASLLDWVLPAEDRDFNLDSLDGEISNLTQLMSCCGNLPFGASRRVVMVRRAEQLDGIARAGEDAPARGKISASKRLADALAALPATTVLILSRTPQTPESGARKETARCINAAVDKAIEAVGLVVNCTVSARAGDVAVAALYNEAARRGIPMARGAAEHLVARGGHNIAALLSELEKCSLRAGEGQQVTAAIVNEMTPRAPQDSIFELVGAIGARNGAHAVGLFRSLLADGQSAEYVLTMMVRHLRQLLQARAFLDARVPLDSSAASRLPAALAAQLPADNLAGLLQRQSWLGGQLAAQARNYSTEQLQASLAGALDVELAHKGIENEGGPLELLMEIFIARLC